MRQKLGNPCRAGSAGAPDPQSGIDGLDRLRGQVVELEVCLLVPAFPEAGEVGLVPHLEVPGAHFVLSVARFHVTNECIDQIAPAIRLWMRSIAMPIEDAVLRCGQRLWRKAELDKRLDVPRQQIVIELVDLRPVIHGLSIFDSNRSQHVVEDRVETNVAKTEFVRDELQLRLAVIANQRAGIIRADRQIEEAIDRTARVFYVDGTSRNAF